MESLSIASGGEIYLRNSGEFRDSISLLDLLYANQFEREQIHPARANQAEVHFYRGAPPQWLNFYLAEQAKSNGQASTFIKRDGYKKLIELIQKRKKGSMASFIKLLHQPGSGGTTLAMQVLWDLRKHFRSAVLRGSTSDITAIAQEVIHLFTAGNQGHQNTVLLLMNDEGNRIERLQDSIKTEMEKAKLIADMPVVIILNCVRKAIITVCDSEDPLVILKTKLSEAEIHQFEKKQIEICYRHSDEHRQFHGFNIMSSNFSPDYVQSTCAVLRDVKKKRQPRKSQLFAMVSLLNAYTPGSYLLQSQCQAFLGPPDPIHGGPSFEQRMEPFTQLTVTYSPREGQDKHVRMAHPMIAMQCVELLAEAGVARSTTAKNLLTNCLVPPCLVHFIREMLTKRETEREKFSRLIEHVEENECISQCMSILKLASKKFMQNSGFPQALARLCYIKEGDYNKAEWWAKEAKKRDPNNSFIADTLGQIHKNHLKRVRDSSPRECLQIANKAIEAFKDAARSAENENGINKSDDMAKVSHFNNRGLFGYVQVANIIFDSLISQSPDWQKILTMEMSADKFLISLGDRKLFRYKSLITSLRDEVERKCEFFDSYLTYSKLGKEKNEPYYFEKDVSDCYSKYVGKCTPRHTQLVRGVPQQQLKENMALTFPGLLSCLDRSYDASQLHHITTLWREITQEDFDGHAKLNFIIANIILSNVEVTMLTSLPTLRDILKTLIVAGFENQTPEFYILALLLFWPASDEELYFKLDLQKCLQQMQLSYEKTYQKHLRSRYLLPLFFLGKGEGYSRLVHRSVLNNLLPREKPNQKWNHKWNKGEMWKISSVQKRLLKVHGVIRHFRIFGFIDDKEIEVCADQRGSICKQSTHVSFYLGFNIRGPVAFGIQYPNVG